MERNALSKLLLIDKPLGWTSFDVVKKIRGLIKKKYKINKIKVGHCGTLDPLASGLLIICTGQLTKTIKTLEVLNKTYTCTMKLGYVTDSFDAETEEKLFEPYNNFEHGDISKVVAQFLGSQKQTPPIFSAIKVNGERLYKKARRGELYVSLKPRDICIYELKIKSIDLPFVTLKIKCSKGTYIRTLVHDIGQKMGCGAYLSDLRRVAIGKYNLINAHKICAVEKYI